MLNIFSIKEILVIFYNCEWGMKLCIVSKDSNFIAFPGGGWKLLFLVEIFLAAIVVTSEIGIS